MYIFNKIISIFLARNFNILVFLDHAAANPGYDKIKQCIYLSKYLLILLYFEIHIHLPN